MLGAAKFSRIKVLANFLISRSGAFYFSKLGLTFYFSKTRVAVGLQDSPERIQLYQCLKVQVWAFVRLEPTQISL